jgi:hypothetical protein
MLPIPILTWVDLHGDSSVGQGVGHPI